MKPVTIEVRQNSGVFARPWLTVSVNGKPVMMADVPAGHTFADMNIQVWDEGTGRHMRSKAVTWDYTIDKE